MKIIWGLFFLCQKEISKLKEEKNDNWGFFFGYIKYIYVLREKDEN
jgi:hypothetical protein